MMFKNDSKITFDMMWDGEDYKCYAPQPSFSRTQKALPIFRFLSKKIISVGVLGYCADFEEILGEARASLALEGYRDIDTLFQALEEWFIEVENMATLIPMDSKKEEVIKVVKLCKSDKDFQASFRGWLSYFFVVCRYTLATMPKSERGQFFTHLSLEDYLEHFTQSLGEVEQK